MCQDRFWSVFAAGVAESGRLKGDSPLAMTSALAIPASAEAETTSIRFRFCDPYKSREQIECHMDLSVHRRPRSRHSSIGSSPLSEIERISFMDRIRRNFPELHAKLRPKSSARNNIVISGRAGDSVTEQRATISVNSIHVDRHFCSANVSRHGDRPEWISMESNGGYVDPWLIHDGPVCKQLTQRLTRCLPRASISIPRSALEDPRPVPQTSRAAAAVSSDDATSVTPQVVLRPESEVGFCTGHAPGQYCIPGTPELAIQCPQGKILRCPRPRATDPAVFSDVGTRSQRCVQMFGAIPGQAGNAAPEKTDAFRKHVIKDVFGREQESGWWARCAYAEA